MHRVFISYRRGDSPHFAGRLFDFLERKFSRDLVFLDTTGIGLGLDFVNVLNERLNSCSIMLAVIGSGWLSAVDKNGKRRIDDPNDFVRLEIETALKRNIRLIPVLVDNANMPKSEDLPDNISSLSQRNAFWVRHTHFAQDSEHIANTIEQIIEPTVPTKPPPSSFTIEKDTSLAKAELTGTHELSSRLQFMNECVAQLEATSGGLRGILVGPLFLHPKWYVKKRNQRSITPNFDALLFDFVAARSFTRDHRVRLIFRNTNRYKEKVKSIVEPADMPRLRSDMLGIIDEIWGVDGGRGPDICCADTGFFKVEMLFDAAMVSGNRPGANSPIDGGNVCYNTSEIEYEKRRFDSVFEKITEGQDKELNKLRTFVREIE